jgi:type IV pilus assembly protein PilM
MNNPLNEITKLFRGLTQSKGKSVVGIDIGASAIKVVQMKESGGKAILETYGSIALAPYDEEPGDIGQTASLGSEALVRALDDLYKEANVTTKRSAFSIPSGATLVFGLSLPASVKESDLKTVVPIEARRYIPVAIEEVTLDYWVLPRRDFKTPGGSQGDAGAKGLDVLVVAVRKDTVSSFKEVMSLAGMNSDFFEVETFSSIRSSLERDLSTVMVVDMGASRTKLAFVDGGILHDVHIINRGSYDVTQGMVSSFEIPFAEAESIKKREGLEAQDEAKKENIKQSVDFILTEMKNAMYQFEQKKGTSIDRIVLSGGGTKLQGLMDYLKGQLNLPIEFSNPFAKTDAPEFLRDTLAISGPEFSVAVGLCLRALKQ